MPANEDLLELMLRHAIAVRRLSSGQVKDIIALLRKSEVDLEKKLSSRLVVGDFTSRRYRALIADIRAMRKELFKDLQLTHTDDLVQLAVAEQNFMQSILDRTIPIKVEFATASAEQLNKLVTASPFAGGTNAARTLEQWWTSVAAADQRRIVESIQLGMIQGETIPQMTRRVMTTAMGYTRANAEAVVRTAVNHVSNSSRELFFQANASVIQCLRWVSTLDGRTTPVCRARDGHFASFSGADEKNIPAPHLEPMSARPPAHPNCRSIMVAVLDPAGIASSTPDRPFVRDTRTGRQREMDFRAEARDSVGNSEWRAMSPAQRNALIADRKATWANTAVGTVPSTMTYDAWLRKQPTSFQNEVLGQRKAILFRKGLRLTQFVDRAGQELTLDELYTMYPEYAP